MCVNRFSTCVEAQWVQVAPRLDQVVQHFLFPLTFSTNAVGTAPVPPAPSLRRRRGRGRRRLQRQQAYSFSVVHVARRPLIVQTIHHELICGAGRVEKARGVEVASYFDRYWPISADCCRST